MPAFDGPSLSSAAESEESVTSDSSVIAGVQSSSSSLSLLISSPDILRDSKQHQHCTNFALLIYYPRLFKTSKVMITLQRQQLIFSY